MAFSIYMKLFPFTPISLGNQKIGISSVIFAGTIFFTAIVGLCGVACESRWILKFVPLQSLISCLVLLHLVLLFPFIFFTFHFSINI